MNNIMDYLEWRGDLPFGSVPFGEADYLVLCRLAYVPFGGIVPEGFENGVPLADAAREAVALAESGGLTFRVKEDGELLRALADSPRFSDVLLAGYAERRDESAEEQFAAVTALLPDGSAAAAFRGTDGTLVGWKEDFNLAFAEAVPAQRDARDYLTALARTTGRKIRAAGHSKGGNLAVYAAAFAPEDVRRAVIEVRSMDGPGFNERMVATDGFAEMIGRTRTYLPQSSIFGMLLEHSEEFTTVHSGSHGVFQHDLYSWEIRRGGFATDVDRTTSSKYVDRSLRDWIAGMTPDERERFADSLYSIITASDGRTLRELWNGKNTLAMIVAYNRADEESREVLRESMRRLRAAMKSSLPELVEKAFGTPKSIAEK